MEAGYSFLEDPKVLTSVATALVAAMLFYLQTTLTTYFNEKFDKKFEKNDEKFEKSEERFQKQMTFQLLVLLVIGSIALIVIVKE